MFLSKYYTQEAQLKVKCLLCSHECSIKPGNSGICGVRKNENGSLISSTYGKIIARNADPIEKKPLYHFLPGSKTFSIASPGCNFRCSFCQNWEISQISSSNNASLKVSGKTYKPEEIVEDAIAAQCQSIAFTYTEPTVFYEFMKDVAIAAKKRGVRCVVVSNGYMSIDIIEELSGLISAYNIDLKSFSESFYHDVCGAHLKPVLKTLEKISQLDAWLEVTTLFIPGENDSVQEIEDIAEFVASLGRHVPWHVSRFFPHYKFADYKITPEKTLENAVLAGKKSELKFVYTGNSEFYNDTICNACRHELIIRRGYSVVNKLGNNGRCIQCGESIDGVWE